MKINEIVDSVYFINLDRRPDRLFHARKQFAKNNIIAKRFSAIDGSNIEKYSNLSRGAAGCLESQIAVIKKALEAGLSSIAIFEDDVFFVDDFENKFSNFYSQVPNDWQFLYLASNKIYATVESVSPNVERIKRGLSAHALLLRSAAMETIVSIASRGDVPIDVYYGIFQESLPAYCSVPSLAGQRADHSDIENVFINYNIIYGL